MWFLEVGFGGIFGVFVVRWFVWVLMCLGWFSGWGRVYWSWWVMVVMGYVMCMVGVCIGFGLVGVW